MGNKTDAILYGIAAQPFAPFAMVALFAAVTGCSHAPVPDRTREDNLLEIIWGLRNVNGIYGETPDSYVDLQKHNFRAPLDPVTRQSYEYERKGDVVTVCAMFDAASPNWDGSANTVKYGDPAVHGFGTWTHGPGRQCLTMDLAAETAKLRGRK